jgi:head-tail adaptor
MLAGRMRDKITIRRRSVESGAPGGNARGAFVDAFSTRAWTVQQNGVKTVEAGLAEDQARMVLRVYDCARNRTITAADRVKIDEEEWSIETVARPDKVRRMIEMILVRKLGG